MFAHVMGVTEGPEEEILSVTLVHEVPRKPTRTERVVDRLLFWRPTPRRFDRIELHFPHVAMAKLAYGVAVDGTITSTMTFTATADEKVKARLLHPPESYATVDLKSFLRS